ncbi:MAG: sigma-54 dependent transcriptional regulator [Planctomycetota bacterium]|nr:sigma-54 dependent transcriptional regulator [Planctomycetota bacterium]
MTNNPQSQPVKKVLIVDDDVAVTNYLMVFLMQTEAYESTVINDPTEVANVLERENFDALLLDMDMPKLTGIDILRMVNEKGLDLPVIILTGVGDVDLAVKSMKLGAFDYLTKPVEDEQLLEVLEKAIDHHAVHNTIQAMPTDVKREDLSHPGAFEGFPTQDSQMLKVLATAEKLAQGELSIFVWGERGTFKEKLARGIHAASPRKDGPFVAISAAAKDSRQFDAELFGQARDWQGTREEIPGFLESASGGTLFIDDIEHLSMPAQERIRRVIQTGEYYRDRSTKVKECNVRFIVASQVDLASDDYKDRFSQDLLYHLMINSLHIPPLRERKDDIPILAEYYLKKRMKEPGGKTKKLAPEFIEKLKQYSFPDNSQELKGLIASATIYDDGEELTLDSLTPYMRETILSGGEAAPDFQPRKLADVQREFVLNTIRYFRNDRSKAAKALDISLEELERILERKS